MFQRYGSTLFNSSRPQCIIKLRISQERVLLYVVFLNNFAVSLNHKRPNLISSCRWISLFFV